jgi:hypothetical protein
MPHLTQILRNVLLDDMPRSIMEGAFHVINNGERFWRAVLVMVGVVYRLFRSETDPRGEGRRNWLQNPGIVLKAIQVNLHVTVDLSKICFFNFFN